MQWLLKKIIGTKNQRDLRNLQPLVDRVNELESACQQLSEEELRGKTAAFKKRLADGETLDDIMCEAFAVVKNACRRLVGREFDLCGHPMTWEMVPFDVQVMGGIVLHQGKIAEMATGEGKTLVATMPLYLNALEGRGAHLVTVNDYLARRDAQWMGQVYEYLGLQVGCIQNQMSPEERRAEYAKDITYGTNSEFGFDYLRDNGAYSPQEQVQRGHHYAMIDEIDSILIDEARTPLIISGPAPISSHQYKDQQPKVERLVRQQRDLCNRLLKEAKDLLAQGAEHEEEAQLKLYQVRQGMPKNKQLMHLLEDPATRKLVERIDGQMLTDMRKEQARALRQELFFTIDERGHDANLTEKGCEALSPGDPQAYVLPDLPTALSELEGSDLPADAKMKERQKVQEQFSEKSERIHNVDQLIRAYCAYEKDVNYVVQDNRVMIVDEYTGRILPGRRWSDGLHQAIEAKEGVDIERETQTLATITIQNYFRMYDKLAGMTGTAETEADEFHAIYKLDVVVIPTNRPVRRVDYNDRIYKTQREKYKAIIDEITDCHQRGQPVLVGTASVENSEVLSRMLRRAGIPHNVLNAKNHEKEADIVARAGQGGAVTIATNMAGRGTDIKLGEGVVYLERDTIVAGPALDDRFDGSTLRQTLMERPCGLHVIGSERHDARRIDRQLRGRCARQGDPGSSRFYVSLEDDLMRLFGSDRVANIMTRMGLEEGQEMEHRWLNRSIETAQRRVEQHNFSIRKRTLEYDDVMNKQREIVYGLRSEILGTDNVREDMLELVGELIGDRAAEAFGGGGEELAESFVEWANTTFPLGLHVSEFEGDAMDAEQATTLVLDRVTHAYELKAKTEDPDVLPVIERHVVLQSIDSLWQDYLRGIDGLREAVGLRAYGQRDPLVEYKREAFEMFTDLMDNIRAEIAGRMFRSSSSVESFDNFMSALNQSFVHEEVGAFGAGGAAGTAAPARGGRRRARGADGDDAVGAAIRAAATVRRDSPKIGRNDPCPCGSGKKYKKCCGAA
ncbi:MAG: preprotein translocase subunit SecA [Kiritimatiellae bacterium]|nr:preprotein translocase subunit SecA [Kiritimatiellia bacterium]